MEKKGSFIEKGIFGSLIFLAILSVGVVFSYRSCDLNVDSPNRGICAPPDIGIYSVRIDRAIAREIKGAKGREILWERRNRWIRDASWVYSHREAYVPEGRIQELRGKICVAVRALGGSVRERISSQKFFSFYALYKGFPVGYYLVIARSSSAGRGYGTPKLAIIIDDVGYDRRSLEELFSIGIPLTISIIPGTPRAADLAKKAFSAGMEVIIHMPMESYGMKRGKRNLGAKVLTTDMEEEEIRKMVRAFIEEVPYAVGANNHMGSRFTEREDLMRPVLEELKEEGFFFVDSRTSNKSIAYSLARSMGIRTGYNMIFLDPISDKEAIKRRIRLAVEMARRNGYCIAIGHYRPRTVMAFLEMERELKGLKDVRFVHVSEVVR